MATNHYAWIDRAEGLQPILDENEKAVTLESKSCRAKSADGKLRCVLDAVHQTLKNKHLHRNQDGTLQSF